MAEVQSRPSTRSRGSGRGGRGGYSSRGGRSGYRQSNGAKVLEEPALTMEDEGEVGELKKHYSVQLGTIREMFPNWTDEDIVFALHETDGDLQSTIERITEGNVAQWGEVKKKTKEKARAKGIDGGSASVDAPTTSRGGRGRGGLESGRGGRGRGTERGRGVGRGARAPSGANVPRASAIDKALTDSTPDVGASSLLSTENKGALDTHNDALEGSWDQPIQKSTTSPDASSWELVTPAETNVAEANPPAVDAPKSTSKPDGTRSWASMFTKPATPITRPKAAAAPAFKPKEPSVESPAAMPLEEPVSSTDQGLPPPAPPQEDIPPTPPSPEMPLSEPSIEIEPSKDELTETNLEKMPDTSIPPSSATAASTAATTQDPRSAIGTPNEVPQQQPSAIRPGLGGFATSAMKATGGSARTPSYHRRMLEQQEAVVMPGNHAMDRTAVQFGSMGLNADSSELDVDEDREEAETRTQPPQHSPVAPRATLPPPPAQQPSMDSYTSVTPKAAPGLPPAVQQAPTSMTEPEQSSAQTAATSSYPYSQFGGRFGPSSTQGEQSAPSQKAYEPFGQQVQQHSQASPYEGYGSQPQQANASAQTQAAQPSGYSSAAQSYPSYYTSDSQRNAYQNYYSGYGQPSQQPQPDSSAAPQRSESYGTSAADQSGQYATSQVQPQPQPPNRYGQATDIHQNSGHSTPNPLISGQPSQSAQNHQTNPAGQQHPASQMGAQPSNYGYGAGPYYSPSYYNTYASQMNHQQQHSYGRERPMFDDVRRYDDQYAAHSHQYGYGGAQAGYGVAPYGKGPGMYGNTHAHQGFGMSPQASYDHHSSSPANVGGYGQSQSMPGRDSGLGGFGGYGRSGSTNPADAQSQQQGNSSAGFSNMQDMFNRTQSGFSGQNQTAGQQQQQSGQAGEDSSARGSYGDVSKIPGNGPSPASGQPGGVGASGRPGSAANNMQGPGGAPSQQQSQQGGYGGYPSQMHSQQAGQYGAGPGANAASHHQQSGQQAQAAAYGGYGAAGGFGGGYYGGGNTRGGWSGSYGH
ncbi:RNAPII degradation factor [Agyrium rufum]|nr:RNAPII degradation factor [Agyrium rufum]